MPLIISPAQNRFSPLRPSAQGQPWLLINPGCHGAAARQKGRLRGRRPPPGPWESKVPEVTPPDSWHRPQMRLFPGTTEPLTLWRAPHHWVSSAPPRRQSSASQAGNWQGSGPAPGDSDGESLLSPARHPHLPSGAAASALWDCLPPAPRAASLGTRPPQQLCAGSCHLPQTSSCKSLVQHGCLERGAMGAKAQNYSSS